MMNIETPTTLIYSLIGGMSLGAMATPHCFGMCGPLHMAICLKNKNSVFKSITLFNIGRIIGYTLIGAILGLLGSIMSDFFTGVVHGHGKGIKPGMFVPILVMLYISFNAFRKKGVDASTDSFGAKFLSKAGDKLLIPVGMLAALIPCGILYVAFGVAVGTSNFLFGAAFMFGFVVSQTFFMEIAAILGKSIHAKYADTWNKVFPWGTLFLTIVYLAIFLKKVL